MYEKTIASEQLIFEVTLPTTQTLAFNLLSDAQKAEYDELFVVGRQYLDSERMVRRIPVDGYILCTTANFYVAHKRFGAEEIAVANERYTFPLGMWLNRTWIRADFETTAIMRIFFS